MNTQTTQGETNHGITFSKALELVKTGKHISRTGFNGKGQYIALQGVDNGSKMTQPYLYIHTVDGGLVPWFASQTDILSNDWFVVGNN